ncbi:hypothetical protein AN2343V1_5056 (plasmid) [Klebsiella pneumoniae]|nr:hypothetical protein AN2343V1_5056 [Klebsiella pneumoniae]CAH6266321.1 hypothetical protein AN2343V1_5056 [Klebsiella pneumoniae]
MKEKQADPIKTFRAQWAVMTFYERFEQVIALALSATATFPFQQPVMEALETESSHEFVMP